MKKILIGIVFLVFCFSSYCQNFNAVFEDVSLNTDMGFDDIESLSDLLSNGKITTAEYSYHLNKGNSTLGEIRQESAKEVLKYVESVIDFGTVSPDIIFKESLNVGPSGNGPIGSASGGTINVSGVLFSYAEQHIQTTIDPNTNAPDFIITMDFGYDIHPSYPSTNATKADLFTIILHEITHDLGMKSNLLVDVAGVVTTNVSPPYSSWDKLLKFKQGTGSQIQNVINPNNTRNYTGITNSSNPVFYQPSGLSSKFHVVAELPKQLGTTFSHFESNARGIKFLMSSEGTANTVIRKWNAVELMALCDLGYSLKGNASTYPFGCTLPPLGVDDNDNYVITPGVSYKSYDILANDTKVGGNSLTFDNTFNGNNGFLLYTNQDVGKIKLVNDKLLYYPKSGFCGKVTLMYRPKDKVTGRQGIPAFVYIDVPCQTCPDDPCSYICNGDFEYGIPDELFEEEPSYFLLSNIQPPDNSPVDFWWEGKYGTPDLHIRGTSKAESVNVSPNPDSYSGAPNNRYMASHFHGSGSAQFGEVITTQSMDLKPVDVYEFSALFMANNSQHSHGQFHIFSSSNYYAFNSSQWNGASDVVFHQTFNIPLPTSGWISRTSNPITGLSGKRYFYIVPVRQYSSGSSTKLYIDKVKLYQTGPRLETQISVAFLAPNQMEYTIEVTNNGSVDAIDVEVKNTLSSKLSFSSSNLLNNLGNYTFPLIKKGETKVITITGQAVSKTDLCDPLLNNFKIVKATPSIGCFKFDYDTWFDLEDDCDCKQFVPPGDVELECNESIILEVCSGYQSYLWNTGETTEKITVNEGGVYTVTLTDGNGNITTNEYIVKSNCCEVEDNNVAFEKEYFSSKYAFVTKAMSEVDNDDYLIAGELFNKTAPNQQANRNEGFGLVRISSTGNIIWSKKYLFGDENLCAVNQQYNFRNVFIEDLKYLDNNEVVITVNTEESFYSSCTVYGNVLRVNTLDGTISYKAKMKSDGSTNMLDKTTVKSICKSYSNTNVHDGYIITGEISPIINSYDNRMYMAKYDLNNVLQWKNKVDLNYSQMTQGSSEILESIPIQYNNGTLNGYLLASHSIYAGQTNQSQIPYIASIELLRVTSNGTVDIVKNITLHSTFPSGPGNSINSNIKLIQVKDNSSFPTPLVPNEYILMYGYKTDSLCIMKLDDNLDVIWSYKYSTPVPASNIDYTYDIRQEGNSFKILTSIAGNGDEKAAVFEIGQNGNPLYTLNVVESQFSTSKPGFSRFSDCSDRLNWDGNQLISAGSNISNNLTIVKWDQNNETTCMTPYSIEFYLNNINTVNVEDYSVSSFVYDAESFEVNIEDLNLEASCCNNFEYQQDPKGCNFILDFDYLTSCDPYSIQITDLETFGVGSSVSSDFTYSWIMNGSVVSDEANPIIPVPGDGTYVLCLKVIFDDGVRRCEDEICKTIVITSEEDNDLCNFDLDYSYDFTCDPFEINITSVDITNNNGPGGRIENHTWVLKDEDGNIISENTDNIPDPSFLNLEEGIYELCLKIKYIDDCKYCEKEICKTIVIEYQNDLSYCDFEVDFDFDVPCGGNLIHINSTSVTGAGSGSKYNSWKVDGNDIATDEWDNLTNLSNGEHEVCLTVTYKEDCFICTKTICKTILVGPETESITLETCGPTASFDPGPCDPPYYAFTTTGQLTGNNVYYVNSSFNGPGCSGWVVQDLPLGTYTTNYYDVNGCLLKVLTIHVIPKPSTFIPSLIDCLPEGGCKTYDVQNLLAPCMPIVTSFTVENNDPSSTYVPAYVSPTKLQICTPPGGIFNIIGIGPDGCKCEVSFGLITCSSAPPLEDDSQNVGIGDKDLNLKYNVYPNPTNGKIIINFNGEISKGAFVKVYNQIGAKLMEFELARLTEIDLSKFAKGIYTIEVFNGSQNLKPQKIILK